MPRVVDRQWNGDKYDSYQLSILVPAAGAATEDTCGDRVSAMDNGNAYDQLPSQLLVPAAEPAPGTMPLEWRFSAMENGECSPGSQPTLQKTRDTSKTYLSSDRDPQWRWQWSLEIEQSTSLRGADA